MKTLLEELESVVLETELKFQEMTELDAIFGNFRQFGLLVLRCKNN